jgi:hypothetical protein
MTQVEQEVSTEYKVGRAEMKNEITTLIEEFGQQTLETEDDGSDFFKNRLAIAATLGSLNQIIKRKCKV